MRFLYCNSTVRRLGFGLPRSSGSSRSGIFLNYLGWGGVMPFEVIYLHDGRGFSVGVAGLVVGTVTGLAVVAAPVAGPVIDRFGARATAAGAGMALAAGYAGLAFAHAPWQAFVAAAAAGIGNGALIPSQSALAGLARAAGPPPPRHGGLAGRRQPRRRPGCRARRRDRGARRERLRRAVPRQRRHLRPLRRHPRRGRGRGARGRSRSPADTGSCSAIGRLCGWP